MQSQYFQIRTTLILLLFPILVGAQPDKLVDKVVAVVGDDVALLSDIESQLDEMSSTDTPIDENTRCRILEDLMYQKLFLNQAKEDSITASEAMVDQEMSRRMRYFVQQFGSEAELEKFYGKTIDEIKEEFREQVRNLLLVQQMQQLIVEQITVSPAEVRAFYKSIPKDSLPYINTEIEVGQIVRIPPISAEEENRIKEELKGFRKRIVEGGEDFGTLAVLYSDDPGSSIRNGELGFTDRTDLVPAFASAAIALEKGEVSNIVKTQFGYHLIQMIERKGDRINVRHILRVPKVSSLDLRKAKLYLDSIKTLIEEVDSITFAKAASQHSDDEQTRLNGGLIINPMDGTNTFDMETLGQVDNALFFSVERLKVGEMSDPEPYRTPDGKKAYRILKLVDLKEPHVANMRDDYVKLQGITRRRKENEALEKWIVENKDNAYIWVTDEFESCPFKTGWRLAQR